MNLGATAILFALIVPTAVMPARAGDVLDRSVATVNGSIILQSDWEDAIRFEAFVAKQPLNTVSPADRKAALDHLIDQELLRQQMRISDSAQPGPQEIDNQIADIRKQYAIQTDAQWKDLLSAHQLTEDEVRRRLALQLELTRLVDVHLRPAAIVTSKSIEIYYQQELLPQLRQSGSKEVSFAEVSVRIKEILTQQKISELLLAWLHDLRAGSQIHTQIAPPAGESVVQ